MLLIIKSINIAATIMSFFFFFITTSETYHNDITQQQKDNMVEGNANYFMYIYIYKDRYYMTTGKP